jgi:hypothetical protein
VNDADPDPENELISQFSFNESNSILSISENGSTYSQDLSSLIDDADSDPENERIASFSFNSTNQILSLTEGGVTYSEDLGSLLNDEDSNPQNELIESFSFDTENSTLSLTDPGGTITEDLSSLKNANDWQIVDGENIIYNSSDLIGVGTETPNSTLQINGSIAYAVTKLDNQSGAVNYNVTLDDHIIVCNIGPTGSSDITIAMPDPTEIEGREIIIRKTGQGPYPAEVIIDFGGFQLDYSAGGLELDDNNRATATLISIGADGWIRIDE